MIRVGLVGYGLAGKAFHAPLILSCDRMELAAVLTSRDAPAPVRTLDELIERSDLVVVASPNQTHFPIAKAALEAGRHVVVDKPFTVALDEADELIALAEQKGRVLSVFHNRRWDSDFLTVRKIMPRLGEVMLFESHWDRFRPQIKEGWRERPEAGGGVLSDLGPHHIDQALQLFGTPEAIGADICTQRANAVVDDYFDVTFHYGRRRVRLCCSTLVAEPRPRFAIHGTGGSYIKLGLDPQEAQLKEGLEPGDPSFGIDSRDGIFVGPTGEAESVPTSKGNHPAFYEGMADAILEGAPSPVAPQDARDGLLLINLARRASLTGSVLPVPAANSPEASAPAA